MGMKPRISILEETNNHISNLASIANASDDEIISNMNKISEKMATEGDKIEELLKEFPYHLNPSSYHSE